jgi:hypothetical protein
MIDSAFVTGGNAYFAIEPAPNYIDANGRKGVEVLPKYVYRVRRKEANGDYKEAWFISLLVEGEDKPTFAYLGMLNPDAGTVHVTGASCSPNGSQEVEILRRVLAKLWAGEGEAIEKAGWKVGRHFKPRQPKQPKVEPVPVAVADEDDVPF